MSPAILAVNANADAPVLVAQNVAFAIIAAMMVLSNSAAILCSFFGEYQGYGQHVSPKFSFTMFRSRGPVVPSLLRSKTLG